MTVWRDRLIWFGIGFVAGAAVVMTRIVFGLSPWVVGFSGWSR